MTAGAGRLDVVATPIGNLGDISERARATLAAADLVAAEDTRRTGELLQALGLSRPLLSLHDHNETQRVPQVLAQLARGAHVALVSDAGSPLISDPGYELVRAAIDAGCDVRGVPGPSAVIAALSVSGLPTDRFCFEGFLPTKGRERTQRLIALAHEPRTLVFFEAPHRIVSLLEALTEACGAARRAVVARELTKTFETLYRGTLAELSEIASRESNFARGEITVVLEGASEEAVQTGAAPAVEEVLDLLLPELPPARAAALAAQITGRKRADVYALAVARAERKAGKTR